MKELSFNDCGYVLIPSRPDIEQVVVLPERAVYFNLLAQSTANVTRIVFDGDQPDFTIYRLARFQFD